MGSKLWQITQWAKANGPVMAVDRISMMVLTEAVKEGIVLRKVRVFTECSPELEQQIREAAEAVVGKPCPV